MSWGSAVWSIVREIFGYWFATVYSVMEWHSCWQTISWNGWNHNILIVNIWNTMWSQWFLLHSVIPNILLILAIMLNPVGLILNVFIYSTVVCAFLALPADWTLCMVSLLCCLATFPTLVVFLFVICIYLFTMYFSLELSIIEFLILFLASNIF